MGVAHAEKIHLVLELPIFVIEETVVAVEMHFVRAILISVAQENANVAQMKLVGHQVLQTIFV